MPKFFDKMRAEALIQALAPDRPTRIVDIGANPVNPPEYGPLLDMGGCEVWGFEPQPKAYDRLVKEAAPGTHYLPYAVGDGGAHVLHVCNTSGFSSLLEPNPEAHAYLGKYKRAMRVTDRIDVETKRLDDMDELPEFDLLKIDIQGGEQAVFDNGTARIGSAVAVITEIAAIPLYKDQPLLDDQMRSLRGMGYHLHKFDFFKAKKCEHRATRGVGGPGYVNQLIDGDAIFVRDLLGFAELGDESLKHLAILADCVFESFDLALIAVSALERRGAVSGGTVPGYRARLPGQVVPA